VLPRSLVTTSTSQPGLADHSNSVNAVEIATILIHWINAKDFAWKVNAQWERD
jgi:hypothetical protein